MVEKKNTADTQKKASAVTGKTASAKSAATKSSTAKTPAKAAASTKVAAGVKAATDVKAAASAKSEPSAKAEASTKAEPSAKAEASTKATATSTVAKTSAKKTVARKAASTKTAGTQTETKSAITTTTAAKKATAKPAAKSSTAKAAPANDAEAKKAATAVKTEATKKATTAKKAEAAKKATTAKKAAAAVKTEDAKKATTAKKVEAAKKAAATSKPKAAAAKVSASTKEPVAKTAAKPSASVAKSKEEPKVDSKATVAASEDKAVSNKTEMPVEAESGKTEKKSVEQEAATPKLEFSDVPGVLIAAAECAPLVKVGGMADVVGALPKYLKKLGVDARVILPFHRQIKERYAQQAQHMADFQASLGWRSQYVGLERLELDGVVYYFIDNEFYFGGDIYCGGEFEGEQYAFFTRAVMDSIPLLDFDVKILHCNDWHTAMMPLLAKTQYQGGMQAGLRTVLTIHNLHFQGQFSHEFDRDLLRVDDSLATPEFIEHYGCDNMLKAGIVFADKVNTVSPTYAREICEPYLGESLDGVLRSRGGDLWGILNGIDAEVWNPQTDASLPVHYSAGNLSGKTSVRDALLEELGLQPAGENTAVISMVGRLTPQKGIDLVQFVLDELMYEDIRLIILGAGYPEYEDFLRNAEGRHKGRLCSYIGYNADLSHRIYAGSDLFLMPSLFEPCGISQMIAMTYGTLPIVHETGGLKDTVMPYNEFTGEGNGFSFANYDAGEMLNVIRYALGTWRNGDARNTLMMQAMASDFSFDRCARTYAELYRALV